MSHPRRTTLLSFLFLFALLLVPGCKDPTQEGTQDEAEDTAKPTVAYITNGIASFWDIAEAGAKAGGEEFGVNVEVMMPQSDDGPGEQRRMIEDLLTKQIDGIAISPIDPAGQTAILNEAAANTILITQDSDAPTSDRVCFVGISNYDAGRTCGELIKEAMPEGGNVMMFVGRMEQLNAQLRRQGIIDVLLERDYDPDRRDPADVTIDEGTSFVILPTQIDGFDEGRCKELTEDAIATRDDLDCIVGLFAYNAPKMLDALRGADMLGEIQVVSFDEDDATLQAIIDGHCYGTVVQDPYEYGRQSVRILAGLVAGDESVLPEDGFYDIPARKVTRDGSNGSLVAEEYWAELKKLLGQD